VHLLMAETSETKDHGDDYSSNQKNRKQKKWIVCLSDGGTRAIAFQIGGLIALRQLGMLKHVGVICASGSGCVTALLLMKNVPSSVWVDFVHTLATTTADEQKICVLPPATTGDSKRQQQQILKNKQTTEHHMEANNSADADDEEVTERTSMVRARPSESVLNILASTSGGVGTAFQHLGDQAVKLVADAQKYACENIERYMTIARLLSVHRWCSSRGGDYEYLAALRNNIFPNAVMSGMDSSAADADYPIVVLESAAETLENSWQVMATTNTPHMSPAAADAADKPVGAAAKLLPALTNAPLRISPCSPLYTLIDVMARLTLPAVLGQTQMTYGRYAYQTVPTTELDPLALVAARVYRLKSYMPAACILLLDGFTDTDLARQQSPVAQQKHKEDN